MKERIRNQKSEVIHLLKFSHRTSSRIKCYPCILRSRANITGKISRNKYSNSITINIYLHIRGP
jgi:hypothetical protein